MPLKIIGQTEIEWKRERQWTDRRERDSEQTGTTIQTEKHLVLAQAVDSQLVRLAEKHQVEQTLWASGSVPK